MVSVEVALPQQHAKQTNRKTTPASKEAPANKMLLYTKALTTVIVPAYSSTLTKGCDTCFPPNIKITLNIQTSARRANQAFRKEMPNHRYVFPSA